MKNKVLAIMAILMMPGTVCMGALNKPKSTELPIKRLAKYAGDEVQGEEKTAEKKSGNPATVTSDSVSVDRPKTFDEIYNEFRQQARTEYENFRDQANREYADFVRQTWEDYQATPALPKPKEEEKPPVVIPKEEEKKPVEDKPIPIEDKVIPPPVPEPQPVPVAPIREQPSPVETEKYVVFTLYGTEFKVRFSEEQHFRLASCDRHAIADAWVLLSGSQFNNTIRDCLSLRIERQLSDWAYLKILQKMAEACLGKSNEATLLMAYVYCQSGYQMRLGVANGRLYMLYGSRHTIYDQNFYRIDGEKFYPLDCQERRMSICEAAFPKEQALSLYVSKEQLLSEDYSEWRTLSCSRMEVRSRVNKNLIAFYNDYPSSMLDDNVMTRWAMYANTPLSESVRKEVLPALREKLTGLSQKEAVEKLLYFTQMAYTYKRDDDVWGHDRAFFPEETLYYPYNDCEDRSIFLSRIVRDLMGLKCILIFYPGHLAMAVRFTEDVKGDYIMVGGEKFVVCDPTYIGAPIGKTMPGMDNQSAQVILLE